MFRSPLKLLFYSCLLIIFLLVGYKIYLNIFMQDFTGLHTQQVEKIDEKLNSNQSFSFAVVGNINNSIGVFEDRIIPKLNASDIDFVVSAGNAVSGGGEAKYRALYGSLSHLHKPYLLTFGPHENDGFGSFRFSKHFGPPFYSIRIGHSRLIFLDDTGKTQWQWQIHWLDDLLNHDDSIARILFIGRPIIKPKKKAPFVEADDYLQPQAFKQALVQQIRKHNIKLVFSANLSLYSALKKYGTEFITTGGAGGLVLNDDISFYHYVKVSVDANGQMSHQLKRLEIGQHPIQKRLESLWFFTYSLLYTGYLNFILILAVLIAIAIKLYTAVFVEKNYYQDYDLDPTPWLDKRLNIAMFTNNYLPFIGGVPISIQRLRQGLMTLGHNVFIIAPYYKNQTNSQKHILRVPTLLSMGHKQEFQLANIFLIRIRKQLKIFRPDIIHLHHPFWLGSLGLFFARTLRVPAVYTYHTRLEHYAHFVPLPGVLFRNLISHALIRRFANKCDGVIVPTYSTEEYLRMIGVKTPIFIQPTGIEFQKFQKVSSQDVEKLRKRLKLGSKKVLISVSRLSNEKNIDFMIEAMALLHQRCDIPYHFFIIGEGHQYERLQQKIIALGLEEYITLTGAVAPQDMITWYHLGDVFLFSSKSETQGMVILEAMAAGLPVVALRSSGIEDVVRQGLNGFKTPENQNIWAEKVKGLLEDDSLRASLSAKAHDFAKDFSIEQFAANIQRIYATTLALFHKKRSKK